MNLVYQPQILLLDLSSIIKFMKYMNLFIVKFFVKVSVLRSNIYWPKDVGRFPHRGDGLKVCLTALERPSWKTM
ncbi:hypothetical protein BZG23_11750 [Salinivibrio sp. ML290]|nr:hypothetical protein BZG23_11750 [Salinivibrio sp. ML290]